MLHCRPSHSVKVAERGRVFHCGTFRMEVVGFEEFAGGGGGFPSVEATGVVGEAAGFEGLGQGGGDARGV